MIVVSEDVDVLEELTVVLEELTVVLEVVLLSEHEPDVDVVVVGSVGVAKVVDVVVVEELSVLVEVVVEVVEVPGSPQMASTAMGSRSFVWPEAVSAKVAPP